ncbi:MAG TPA: GH25 family lysozyme [Kofleriaceae bacterium]
MTRALLFAAVLAPACMPDLDTDAPVLAETEQAMSVCADGPTTYGIDVSRFQGDINWQLVAGSGVKYAWIQISRSLTDIDLKFPYNWQQAKANGILRGAYQRFRPGMDVMGQAKLFVDKLAPVLLPGDMPPMLDVEDADGLTGPQIAAAVQQWMNYVEPRIGMRPFIYTGFYFWRDSVGGADFSQHPLWIANYSATCPLVPPHWTKWTFHQYSSTAMIPGITANTVDVNKFNGTLAQLQALGQTATCGDNTCNGDETTDSCEEDCPPCHVIGEGADAVVDDSSACFRTGGDPQFIREENAGYGSQLKWTHASDAATPANFGRWDLHFAKGGTYRVEAFTPAPYNGSKQTVYTVHHADNTTEVAVDQSAVDGWNVIGEHAFVAGSNGQYIRLNDNTGEPASTETKIVFDALRFTLVDDGAADGDPAPDDEPSSGGCSSSGGSSVWLVLAAFLLRRRRAEISPTRN